MVEVSRREFMQLAALVTAGIAAGCTRGELTTASTAADLPLGDLPYSIWEQVREVVRASPDHLPAAAARAVASKNPEEIFTFVRDRISVLPPSLEGFTRSVTGRRWGARGTLRCGFGTPRERVDLLVDLYRQAGYDAEVVEGDLTVAVDPVALLARRTDLTFAPPVDSATVGEWHRLLSITAGGLDPGPGPDEADALASSLLALLGSATGASAAQLAPPGRVPLVRVLAGGEERLANPLLATTPFGEGLVTNPVTALTGDVLSPTRLTLSYATTTNPAQPIQVAEREFDMEDVVGRQLFARFVPSGGAAELFRTPLDQIPCFTAMVGLDAPDFGPADMERHSTLGDSITIGGDLIQTPQPNTAVVGAEQVGGDPTAASRVAGLMLSVSALAFPSLFLQVTAVDSAGAPVLDIPAEAFSVGEAGTPMSFTITASHAPQPSILLLFDGSQSLPTEFRGEGAVELAGDLAAEILSVHAGAQFRIGGVNYGTASVSPAWLASAADVRAEARRVIADGSELWSALADTRSAGASLVVLVTDARATDTDEQREAARPWVHGGPPVLVIGVGDFDAATGKDIATTSGGSFATVATRAAAIESVGASITMAEISPYRVQYRAPMDGPTDRTVRIGVGAVAAEGTYVVPAEPLPPPSVSGIYLSMAIGSQATTRTLAGLRLEDATPTTSVPTAMLEEVRHALVGGTLVSIEAGPPTAAVWLDDFLTAKISQRPLYEHRNDGFDPQIDALAEGIHSIPTELPGLQGPALGASIPIIPSGPHVVLLAGRPLPDGSGLGRADVLPFASWASPTSGGDSFADTLRGTAPLSIQEAWLFPDSTLGRLAGRRLEVIPAGVPAPRDGPAAPWARLLDFYSAHHRIIPTDSGPFAFWAVDRNGSLIGVLPDGSGGGSAIDDIAEQCSDTSRIAAATQLSGSALGLPFAGLVSLQKAIALQALKAAAVIATLEDPKVPPACDKGLGDLACDWAKDTLAAGSWTGYGKIDTADDVVEAAGGGGLVDC